MTPARWRQVDDLFNAALDLPEGERKRWLRETCAGDRDLYDTVLGMLFADDARTTGNPIADAIIDVATTVLERDSVGVAPQRVGAYDVLREIGSGGMSTVYLATRADDQYHKQVAVKLINRGLARDTTLERFLQERQILANLDHPHVARLLDGGAAPDGRPYLILEYVEGEAISSYCESNHLSIKERCRLLLKVCEAVAYAHQNLIIHRDLKPANILVTADGTPKLLDFGIAKLIDEQSMTRDPMTRAAAGLMTPEYASPEQVRGQLVTTATDVYSLGAILFELLTRQRAQPIESTSPTELVRVVCEREVLPPSRVASERIPRDLDNIVLKAMEKDPRRRYSSVEQFADDIRRHLDDMPVLARGSSPLYRAGKFASRHWVPILALLATVVSLAGGVVVAQRQAREADRLRLEAVRERDRAEGERRRAEEAATEAQRQRGMAQLSATEAHEQRERAGKRFDQLRTLIQRFLFEIDKAVEDLPGTSNARRVVAKTALEYLDGMAKESIPDAGLKRDLAAAYERVGELQGSTAKPSLGDTAGALTSYAKALALRQGSALNSLEARRELMLLHMNIGTNLRVLNRLDEATKNFDLGLNLREGPWREDPRIAEAVAGLLHQKADLLGSISKSQNAVEAYREAETIYARLAGMKPGDPSLERSLASTRMQLGIQFYRLGNYPQALPALHQSLDDLSRLSAKDPGNAALKRMMGIAMRSLGNAYLDRTGGEYRSFEKALSFMERSRELTNQLAAADSMNRVAQRDAIRALASVARAYAAFDKWEESSRLHNEALEKLHQFGKSSPNDQDVRYDIGLYNAEICTAEFRMGHVDQSEAYCQRGREIYDALSRESNNRFHRFNSALLVRKLGEIALARGNKQEAGRLFDEAMAVFQKLAEADKATTMFQLQIGMTRDVIKKLSE
jgi:tetratricopeptide (TPR) repeat protein